MKIKKLIYLALLPLSIAGAVLSYKSVSKKRNKGIEKNDELVLGEDISEFNKTDAKIFHALNYIFRCLAKDDKFETTAKRFHLLMAYSGYITEEPHIIGRSFSKFHKHYPDIIYKKKINGKEVRTNTGYLWVYEPGKNESVVDKLISFACRIGMISYKKTDVKEYDKNIDE